MQKVSGSEDVYRELVEESDDHWLLGLLAFAVMEQQRIEWAKHLLNTTGAAPGHAEVKAWYESQPPSALLRARADAETTLKNYGEEAIEEFDDAYRKEIAQGIVIGEIQKLGRWWPQLGINIAGGVIGSIVFTAILVIVALFLLTDSSANEIAQHLMRINGDN